MLFSILIPAYKGQYLKECIDSVIGQSYQSFEIIILNDCSPDDIDSIVNEYSDQRIRYYKNDVNVGAKDVVYNWNKCLDLSLGEYVICMGDDDLLSPGCLEKYKNAINDYPDIKVFHCRSFIVDELSKKISLTTSWPLKETVFENMWHRINYYREQFIGDFLYKKDELVNKGGFYYLPFAWASDDITSYMAMEDRGIIHINDPLFCYRKNSLTITSSGDPRVKLEAISLEERWYYNFMSSHKPCCSVDKVAYSSIEKTLPRYFKRKRIYTIAYCRKTQHYFIRSFVFWLTHLKETQLSLMELGYAFILACKNKFGRT